VEAGARMMTPWTVLLPPEPPMAMKNAGELERVMF